MRITKNLSVEDIIKMNRTIDRVIRRLRHPRRAPDGRFETAVDSTRRDMNRRETIRELIAMPYTHKPEFTAEGCAVV